MTIFLVTLSLVEFLFGIFFSPLSGFLILIIFLYSFSTAPVCVCKCLCVAETERGEGGQALRHIWRNQQSHYHGQRQCSRGQ